MIARHIATGFGLGHLPGAPGTWASAATIPLAWGLHALGGVWLMGLATVGVIGLGWWATARIVSGDEDPSEIVIDEVAGMLIALLPLSAGLTMAGADPGVWPWPGWVLGFLMFRVLDIVKPPPMNWADRCAGAKGVMLDDIAAGLITAGLMVVSAGVAHGWF